MTSGKIAAAFMVALGFCVVVPATAEKDVAKKIEADTIPISETLIRLEAVLSNGGPLNLVVREGGMARIQRVADGYTIGLTPVIENREKGVVKLIVFRIIDRGPGEFIKQVDELELNRETARTQLDGIEERFAWNARSNGSSTSSRVTPILKEIAFAGFAEPNPLTAATTRCSNAEIAQASTADSSAVAPNNPCTRCCVTCDGTRACGCAVEMACGSCCCGSCCP